ncbi:MAG: tetratricopeptide repeat protein [Promethearchaeota archaeon]
MKKCPYCQSPIEDNWFYCKSCEKPLISNLQDVYRKKLKASYEELEVPYIDLEGEEEINSKSSLDDEEINQIIQEIDDKLSSKELLGEPIPGELLIKKSSLYYKKRDFTNALKSLELALKNFKEDNELLNIAICHNEIGLIQEDTGFFDQAIYHFNRSLEILKDLKETEKVIKILNNLGNIYFVIRDLEHSYEYYQEAINISKQENLFYEEIKSSSNLIEVLYLLKDYERIKRILTRNVEFFKEQADIYGIIQSDIKYGKLFYLIGKDYDLAYNHLNKALELIDKVKEKISIYLKSKLEWECYFYLGKLFILWNDSTKAENFLLKSLEAVRIFEIGDNIYEGDILENLAEFYITKGEIERAIEYYNLSSEIFYRFGYDDKNANLKFKVGKLFLEFIENYTEALNYFEEALNIYEEKGYIQEAAIILNKIGDIYFNRGLNDLALKNFDNARIHYKELDDDYNVNLLDKKIKSIINSDNSFPY